MRHQFGVRRAMGDAPTLQVLFDVESLLLDPVAGMRESLLAALRESGLAELRASVTPASSEDDLRGLLLDLLSQRESARVDCALQSYCRHFNTHGRYRCRFRDGSLRLLATLAARSDLCLHYVTHIGAVAAARVLDVYGLRYLPRVVCTGEQLDCPGLRPALIRDTVAASSTPASRWVLLSDHPPELVAARQLGVRCIGLGYGRAPREALQQLPVDALAVDLDDVATLLHGSREGVITPRLLAALH